MKEALQALHAELKRLRGTGVDRVYVEPASLEGLRRAVESLGGVPDAPARAPEPSVRPAAPVPPAREPASSPRVSAPAAAPAAARVSAVFRHEPSPEPAAPALPPGAPVDLPAGSKSERWEWLRARVLGDPVCRAQVRPGKQVVLGVGSLDAEIFFVGEAPGAEEEQRGEPFVGPAGELLTKMILAMGLPRPGVYIGNIMNWRPALPTAEGEEQVGNRPPSAAEMAYCLPFLRAQIEVVQPRVVVALGKTAAEGLLGAGSFPSLGAIRGRWSEFGGKPLMVTYHPSYLLRNQALSEKRRVWEDLMKVMEKVGLPISDKQRGYFLPKS